MELYHHGIKGQKWGVKNGPPYPLRYSYKDGRLTKLGKKTLHQMATDGKKSKEHKEYAEYDRKSKQKVGIHEGKTYDTIAKGSEARRVTNQEEENDNREKYMSLTRSDRQLYTGSAATLVGDEGPIYEDTYKFDVDAKVAKGKEVANYVIDKYGDLEVKNRFKNIDDIMAVTSYGDTRSIKGKTELDKYVYDSQTKVATTLHEKMFSDKKTRQELMDEFVKRGYDAIVDAEDYYVGYSEYPIILLNPSKTVTRTGRKKLL